jgi:hypothetical protein
MGCSISGQNRRQNPTMKQIGAILVVTLAIAGSIGRNLAEKRTKAIQNQH